MIYLLELDTNSLMMIPNSCHLLHTLSLSGCGRLLDDVLNAISNNCKLITNINLDGCYMVIKYSILNIIHHKIYNKS